MSFELESTFSRNRTRLIEDQWDKFLEPFFLHVNVNPTSHMIFRFWVCFIFFFLHFGLALYLDIVPWSISEHTDKRRSHHYTHIVEFHQACSATYALPDKGYGLIKSYQPIFTWCSFTFNTIGNGFSSKKEEEKDSASQFISYLSFPLNMKSGFLFSRLH